MAHLTVITKPYVHLNSMVTFFLNLRSLLSILKSIHVLWVLLQENRNSNSMLFPRSPYVAQRTPGLHRWINIGNNVCRVLKLWESAKGYGKYPFMKKKPRSPPFLTRSPRSPPLFIKSKKYLPLIFKKGWATWATC